MRLSKSFASAAILALAGSAAALSLPSVRSDSTDGVVKLGLKVNRTNAYEVQGTYNENASAPYVGDYYFVDIVVGSQKKPVQVVLDTGSSDLVLDYSSYDPSSSTSAVNLSWQFEDWHTEYDVYTDTVTLGELTIQDLELGVGHKRSNILGVGSTSQEAVPGPKEYRNFPLRLKDSNYIKSAAFSIYLESFDPKIQYGSILFGGIDHAKYTGDLVSYQYTTGSPHEVASVVISGVRFADGQYYQLNEHAVFDTGTTTIGLPKPLADSIQAIFGPLHPNGTVINFQESWKTTLFSFEFANNVITVPYIDFLVEDGAGGYYLQYIWTNEPIVLLGDIFLKNAYTVFNFDTTTIQLAQINYDPKGASNITVI